MSANDDFVALRHAVSGANAVAIDSQSAHAATAWRFLVGFAQVKPAYRSQIVGMVDKLTAVPSWVAVFETLDYMEPKVAALHEDLKTRLSPMVRPTDEKERASPRGLRCCSLLRRFKPSSVEDGWHRGGRRSWRSDGWTVGGSRWCRRLIVGQVQDVVVEHSFQCRV